MRVGLAKAELVKQDGLEETSSDQKIGANLKKKTKAEKEEPEGAGDIVSKLQIGGGHCHRLLQYQGRGQA